MPECLIIVNSLVLTYHFWLTVACNEDLCYHLLPTTNSEFCINNFKLICSRFERFLELHGRQCFTIATNENRDHSTDDVDLSEVQGVFNVLAQVEIHEIESNTLLMKQTDASAQVFSFVLPLLGNVLWDVGKTLLKNKLCPKN